LQLDETKRLPNGAIEIDRRPLTDGSFVVLAWRQEAEEYVTWREFEGFTKWGHYFDGYAAAREDFETR